MACGAWERCCSLVFYEPHPLVMDAYLPCTDAVARFPVDELKCCPDAPPGRQSAETSYCGVASWNDGHLPSLTVAWSSPASSCPLHIPAWCPQMLFGSVHLTGPSSLGWEGSVGELRPFGLGCQGRLAGHSRGWFPPFSTVG